MFTDGAVHLDSYALAEFANKMSTPESHQSAAGLVGKDETIIAVYRIEDHMASNLISQELAACACVPVYWPLLACGTGAAVCYPRWVGRELRTRKQTYTTTLYIVTDQFLYRHVPKPSELDVTCQAGVYDGMPHVSAKESLRNVREVRGVEYIGADKDRWCFPVRALEIELVAGSPLATNGGILTHHGEEKEDRTLLFLTFPPAARDAILAAKKRAMESAPASGTGGVGDAEAVPSAPLQADMDRE